MMEDPEDEALKHVKSNMLGGFYGWQREKSNACDVMTLKKAKRAGGTLTTIGDQGVLANSPVLVQGMLQEKVRRTLCQSKGSETRSKPQWRDIFHEADKTQEERTPLE